MSTDGELKPLHLLSDEPIDAGAPDDLGRDADARLLAELVLGTRGPFTIGVYGSWGTGKTSLLNQVRALLEEKDPSEPTGLRYPYVVPVFFNAWQYEREAEPLTHLTAAIHDATAKRLRDVQSLPGAAKETAVEWLRSVHLTTRAAVYGISIETGTPSTEESAGSRLVGLLKFIPGLKFSAKDSIDRYEKLLQEKEDPDSKVWKEHVAKSATMASLRSLRADEKLLDKIRPGYERRIPRIVVFVDDMDRCSSKDAFKILQGIKLALSQPGFVFILSLNPDTLKPYIAEQTKASGRNPADSTETIYLDKLVQLPFPLRLRDDQFQRFARAVVFERLKELVSASEHEVFKSLHPSLRDSSDQNPRTLKRRINAVIVDARLAPPDLLESLDSDRSKARAVFMGLCLLEQTARHLGKPGLLARLAAQPDLCDLIRRDGVRAVYHQLKGLRARRTEGGYASQQKEP